MTVKRKKAQKYRQKKRITIKRKAKNVQSNIDLQKVFNDKDSASLVVDDKYSYEMLHDTEISSGPYDENLLDKAKTRWQFGDWDNLAVLDHNLIKRHPDRAKLALLAAAAQLQIGDLSSARQTLRAAQEWGCSRRLASLVLISGVHNSLARAAAIAGQQKQALTHFRHAVDIGAPGSDRRLILQARVNEQLLRLGVQVNSEYSKDTSVEMATLQLSNNKCRPTAFRENGRDLYNAWVQGNWEVLVKNDNADLPSKTDRAEIALFAAAGYQQLHDIEGVDRCIRLALAWGCERKIVKSVMMAGIRNTLAITQTIAKQFSDAAKNFQLSLKVDTEEPDRSAIEKRITSQIQLIESIDHKAVRECISQSIS